MTEIKADSVISYYRGAFYENKEDKRKKISFLYMEMKGKGTLSKSKGGQKES